MDNEEMAEIIPNNKPPNPKKKEKKIKQKFYKNRSK